MQHQIRLIAGAVFGLAALVARPLTAPAQELADPPTYARLRAGADDWRARGGYSYGHSGYGYGFYPPYFAPVVYGSWYARPYPAHFDYYRYRWGNAPPPETSYCSCAEEGAAVEGDPLNSAS